MSFNNDKFLILLSAIFCSVIMLQGYWGFKKTGEKKIILILLGIAFGLFSIVYILMLQGLSESLSGLLAILRVVAYLCIITGIYLTVKQA